MNAPSVYVRTEGRVPMIECVHVHVCVFCIIFISLCATVIELAMPCSSHLQHRKREAATAAQVCESSLW